MHLALMPSCLLDVVLRITLALLKGETGKLGKMWPFESNEKRVRAAIEQMVIAVFSIDIFKSAANAMADEAGGITTNGLEDFVARFCSKSL